MFWLLCNGLESLRPYMEMFFYAVTGALKCLEKLTSVSSSKLLKLEKRATDKGARKEWGRGGAGNVLRDMLFK